jgi:hypothetical protein
MWIESYGCFSISRCDAGRNGEPETISFGVVFQRHDILDIDLDRLAWKNVSNTGAEDLWGMLLEQARRLAAAESILISGMGFCFLLDDAFDDAYANLAAEGDDGTGFVEGKYVISAGYWRDIGGIDEGLRELSASGGVVEMSDGRLGDPRQRAPRAVDARVAGGHGGRVGRLTALDDSP